MAQYQLTMRSGPNTGTVYSLEGDQITMGRDTANDIVINDAEISRTHTRMLLQGGKYLIEDMGSTNGTFVNGKRIGSAVVLKSGQTVSLGDKIVFVFEEVSYDPNATILSRPPQPAVPQPPKIPVQPTPQPVQPAPQGYAGQIPSEPPLSDSQPMTEQANNRRLLILLLIFLVLCLCAVSVFLYFAPESFWCLFPIWPEGAC